ncbi:Hypothetical predicted protein [Cloeon dipterum]|uniref:F-box domain-containing protein n=1 Tax=Cloeon dipterum TaxID=197152 RepID=A0A8S1DFF5_9INSE|nr:Hypothetical predicted protein [Cloeon dipterum]
MEPFSLLDLAIKSVGDNIDKYDKEYVKTIIEPVRQMMLYDVFQKVDNHFVTCDGQENHCDQLWAVLPCLINSKSYTTLNTYDLMMKCKGPLLSNSRFQEFIRSLGSHAPNLKELNINAMVYSLEERELTSIIQLKNLAILRINYVSVPLSGILDISRRCEKLKKITANNVKIDEEFSGGAFRDAFVYVCIDMCIPGNIFLSMETTLPTEVLEYADHTHYIIFRLFKPRTIRDFLLPQRFAENLKEIFFNCSHLEDIEDMVEFPHLPAIKCARIICGRKSAHALRCFLKRNGKTLQKLYLSGIRTKENMSLSEIFSSCPNLRCLILSSSTLVGNDAPDVDTMRQLKRFEWIHDAGTLSYNASGCRPCCDEVAFSSILSAPLLEEVDIDLIKIDFSDNATVIARIKRREILRNLKKFHMTLFNETTIMHFIEDYLESSSSYVKSFYELKNAIDSVISA